MSSFAFHLNKFEWILCEERTTARDKTMKIKKSNNNSCSLFFRHCRLIDMFERNRNVRYLNKGDKQLKGQK